MTVLELKTSLESLMNIHKSFLKKETPVYSKDSRNNLLPIMTFQVLNNYEPSLVIPLPSTPCPETLTIDQVIHHCCTIYATSRLCKVELLPVTIDRHDITVVTKIWDDKKHEIAVLIY